MPQSAIPEFRLDEPTVSIAVQILGTHAGCDGEVMFEHASGQRLCLRCGTVGAELAGGAMDFEITENE